MHHEGVVENRVAVSFIEHPLQSVDRREGIELVRAMSLEPSVRGAEHLNVVLALLDAEVGERLNRPGLLVDS